MFLLQQITSSTPPVIRTRFKILLKLRAVLFVSKMRMRIRLELMHTQQVCMIATINAWRHNIFRLMPHLVQVNEVNPLQFLQDIINLTQHTIQDLCPIRATLSNKPLGITQGTSNQHIKFHKPKF